MSKNHGNDMFMFSCLSLFSRTRDSNIFSSQFMLISCLLPASSAGCSLYKHWHSGFHPVYVVYPSEISSSSQPPTFFFLLFCLIRLVRGLIFSKSRFSLNFGNPISIALSSCGKASLDNLLSFRICWQLWRWYNF